MTKYRSLYLHFPFCESRCHYCDFYALGRTKTDASDPATFEDALLRELSLYSDQGVLDAALDTVFFGGGTPSLSSPEFLTQLSLRLPPLAENGEWTMECNPNSALAPVLTTARRLGVNRISLGVQATQASLLKKLGRVHDHEETLAALRAIFGAGFTDVSCDLLCGVPGQTKADLSDSIDELLRFPLTHLSCYLLTLAPHHPMFGDLPNEDAQAEHLNHVHDELTANGFERYEVSNYCRNNLRARHNLAYWTGASYLGLGPSAHSFDADQQRRWKNVSSLHRWAETLKSGELPIEWREDLTSEQRELEAWMLGLRLSDGVPSHWFTTAGREAQLKNLRRASLIEDHPHLAGRVRLTPTGFPLSDSIVKSLVG